MAKEVDTNGWWFIKKNPLSKVGVFPYLGRTISDECVPDKIYNVYRPAETLRDSVPTWDNPPKVILLGHQMVGTDFTSIDDEKVRGVVTNPVFDENTGVLYGDITVYSDELKNAIQGGTKEISLGYFCKYIKEPGVYNGQVYDYVQKDMVGNHVAIVESGRCGSDVKVYDHKCTMDSVDINPTDFMAKDMSDENGLNKNPDSDKIINKETVTDNNTEEKMADKREFIRKIMAIAAKADSDFEGGESEKIETIAKLLEESEYAKSEDNDDVDDKEKETTDKCGKDEDDKEDKKDNTTKDEDDKEKKDTEDSDVVSASEVMAWLKTISEQLTALTSKSAAKDEDVDEEKKDAEDEDDKEKDSEDEDEEKKDDKKTSEDSAVFVFGKTAQNAAEDPALKAYLA